MTAPVVNSAGAESESVVSGGEFLEAAAIPAPAPQSRWQRWFRRLAHFFVGQTLIQMLGVLTGFIMIRWMSVTDYAQYTLANGFQASVAILVELNLGASIIALVGARGQDKAVVGGYIRSVRHYRDRFFLFAVPIVLVAFPILTAKQGWPLIVTINLMLAVLVSLYFQSWSAYYSSALLIRQELGAYYRSPTILGTVKLLVSGLLCLLSMLTSGVAAWLNSITTVIQGIVYRRQSAPYVSEPATSDPAQNREVLQYIRPMIPNAFFLAFQGQINVFLISIFGHSQNLAEVGALGRLAQIFMLLNAFCSVIVEPVAARTPRNQLPKRYLLAVGGAVALGAALVGGSALFPGALLWVLGEKYAHLTAEVTISVASSSIVFVTAVMWAMHSARKWIFPIGIWANIILVIALQVLGATCFELHTTRQILSLALITSAATLVVATCWGLYGFLVFEPRKNPAA